MTNVNFQIPLVFTYTLIHMQTGRALTRQFVIPQSFLLHKRSSSSLITTPCPYGSCQGPLTPNICSPLIVWPNSSWLFSVWLPLCPHGTILPTVLPATLEGASSPGPRTAGVELCLIPRVTEAFSRPPQ